MGRGCQRWEEVSRGDGGRGHRHIRQCGMGQRTGKQNVLIKILNFYEILSLGRRHIRQCGMNQRTGKKMGLKT